MCVVPLDITLLDHHVENCNPRSMHDIHGCTPIRPIRLELTEEMKYDEDPHWRDHVYISWLHSSSATFERSHQSSIHQSFFLW